MPNFPERELSWTPTTRRRLIAEAPMLIEFVIS